MGILVIDDSELIRSRLANFFQGLAEIDTADTLAPLPARAGRPRPAPARRQCHGAHPQAQAHRARHVLIAVLTNDASAFNAERCRQLGADWFFDKSTEFEALLALVQRKSTLH